MESDVDRMVEWCRAQLDADEAAANACLTEVGSTRKGESYEDGSGTAEMDDYPSYPWGSRQAELAFMERFPPQVVLGLVAAHRAILALYEAAMDDPDREHDPQVNGYIGGLNAAVALLASAYAERDSSDDSGRP